MIKTDLCDLLGIEYPIIQGGMAWVADSSLAGAVSSAGGLGLIAAMNSTPEWLRAEIRKTRELTDKPFGVNIMLMSPYADEVAKVVAEEKVKVVTTGAGNPSKYISYWNDAGIKVIPVTAACGHAKKVVQSGAVAVIAEGGESGGHIGNMNTMALVPQVVDAVDVPVIAAGGIADGRGVSAALMLGACGVQMGTRFLAAEECTIHSEYKEKIVKAKDIDTIVTGRRLGHPVRSLKTPFSKNYAKYEEDLTVSLEELEKMGGGALRLAAREGDLKNGCFMAGQCAGLVKKIQPVREIILELMEDAQKVMQQCMTNIIK